MALEADSFMRAGTTLHLGRDKRRDRMLSRGLVRLNCEHSGAGPTVAPAEVTLLHGRSAGWIRQKRFNILCRPGTKIRMATRQRVSLA